MKHPPLDWEETPPHGELFAGCILPMKTPLGPYYRVPPQRAWTVAHAVRAAGPLLVAVFDLTESVVGFYERATCPWGNGVAYHHVPCLDGGAGRDHPPTEEAWHSFALAMSEAEPGRYRRVAVHCKHGFNRTGFMLVRWAVATGVFKDVREAVAEFARVRPPGIYKVEYIQKLHFVFGAPPPAAMPEAPPWRTCQLRLAKIPPFWLSTFAERSPPAPFPSDTMPHKATLIGTFVRPCRHVREHGGLCSSAVRATAAKACGCDLREFGGNQPLAFTRADIKQVEKDPFLVTWKVDGIRDIVVVFWFGTFLLNRRAEVRCIGDLLRGCPPELRREVCPLVADAELVAGTDPTLWLHDLMMAAGKELGRLPLWKRLRLLKLWSKRLPTTCVVPGQGPIRVRMKRWWPASRIRKVMENPRHTPCDGAIFWRRDAPYVSGRDPTLLKWKMKATIDFWASPTFELRLADGKTPDRGELLNKNPEWANAVVECAWSEDPEGWVALFKRDDKPRGNARDVYDATFPVILDPVKIEEIEAATTTSSPLQKSSSSVSDPLNQTSTVFAS